MRTIRSRLIAIAGCSSSPCGQLIPTNVTQRVRDPATGRMKDTTIRRVPINLGLDLQGGIHLALEVDQSKGPVPDCADAIQRAEKVVRTRIDEFGTSEPVVQIQGRCRLIVELAGEKARPAPRASSSARRSSSSASRHENLFRDALPEIDKALRRAGVTVAGQGAAAASVTQLFGTDTGKAKGRRRKARRRKARRRRRIRRPERPRGPLVAPLPGAAARRVSRAGRAGPGGREPAGAARCAAADSPGIELRWGTKFVACRAGATGRSTPGRIGRSSRVNTSRTRRPRATRSPTSRS